MRVVGIIQARMGSSRLPGKVILPIQSFPMIVTLVNRLEDCQEIDQWIVAIPDNKSNDILNEVLKEHAVEIFRGPEEDVLARYDLAAHKYEADVIVRITGDCPLHDPYLINDMVFFYRENTFDLVTNTRRRTFPDGFDCEVFSRELLMSSNENLLTKECREHVTMCMETKGLFNYAYIMGDYSHLRATVDNIEDYHLCKKIFEKLFKLNPYFDWWDVKCALTNP